VALTGGRRREVYRVYSHDAFLAGGSAAEPIESAAAREQGTLRLVVGAALPLGLAAAVTVSLALESVRHGARVAQERRPWTLPARKRAGAVVEHQRRSRDARSSSSGPRAPARPPRRRLRPIPRAHRPPAAASQAASPHAPAPARASVSRPSPPHPHGPEFLFER